MRKYRIQFIEYNRGNVDRARKMRKKPTPAEEKMRKEILQHRPCGYKFTRQKPIGGFIVDFYCAKLYLVIEIDGGIHNSQKEYDEQRNDFLINHKINIVRYKNEEIINNSNQTYQELLECIKDIETRLLQVPLGRGI